MSFLRRWCEFRFPERVPEPELLRVDPVGASDRLGPDARLLPGGLRHLQQQAGRPPRRLRRKTQAENGELRGTMLSILMVLVLFRSFYLIQYYCRVVGWMNSNFSVLMRVGIRG